jgi:DNA helicase-2/ATP-dependent DNA helicase PcrA
LKAKDLDVHAVGDFMQTIYHTSSNPKKQCTSDDKLDCYKKMGFIPKHLNECWRSVDEVCKFADTVHEGEGSYQQYLKLTILNIKEFFIFFKMMLGLM